MVIRLNKDTQRLLQEKIEDGGYSSADDVVRAALHALIQLEAPPLDQDTLAAIERAEDQIERGDVHAWADVREQVRATFRGE